MTNYRDVAAWTGSRTRAKEGFSIATCFDSGDFCFTMLCLKKPTQMKRALILATFGACFFLFVYFTSRVDQQSLMQYKYEDGNVLARLSVPFSQQTNCSENWSIDEFEKGSQKKVSQLMNPSNFISVLAGLNWANISAKSLVDSLLPFIISEPPVPVDPNCKPDPLPKPSASMCQGSEEGKVFTGELRSHPIKIIHSVKLGYDVDMLEVHLNELYEVVDYFVIMESIRNHKGNMVKPLIWEFIRLQARFSKFEKKVIHFVMDDLEIIQEPPESGLFGTERLQELLRWKKIRLWNDVTKFLSSQDLIGFGDSDEIANRVNLHKLRHCALKSDTAKIDMGIWFAYGDLETAFKSDYPVPGYAYSLGNPTFWTYHKASSNSKYPTYARGTSGAFLLGGVHLTNYNYSPYLLTKSVTATESAQNLLKLKSVLPGILEKHGKDVSETNKHVLDLLNSILKGVPKSRFIGVETLLKQSPQYKPVMYKPWFLKCNLDRYPSWIKKLDLRLS